MTSYFYILFSFDSGGNSKNDERLFLSRWCFHISVEKKTNSDTKASVANVVERKTMASTQNVVGSYIHLIGMRTFVAVDVVRKWERL